MKQLEPNSILFNKYCKFSYIGGEEEAKKEVQYKDLAQGGKKLFTQFMGELKGGVIYKYDYYAKGISHFSGLCIFQNNLPVYEFPYEDKEIVWSSMGATEEDLERKE